MGWNDIKRDAADDAFSEWIRRRDRVCQKCGAPGYGPKGITGLDASHWQSRGKEATRFDPLNVDALCRSCHRWFGEHKTEHDAWQVERKGKKVTDRLILASGQYCKKDRLSEKLYWRQKIKDDFGII
jgi:hypothetical protein